MALKGKNPIGGGRRGWLGLAAFFALAFLAANQGCQNGTEVSDPHEVLGMVQYESGEPVAGAIVVATATSLDEPAAAKAAAQPQSSRLKSSDTVLANAKGEFHFDSLLSGTFNLTFDNDSHSANTKKLWIERNVRPILPNKGTGVPLLIKLATAAQLDGTVTDAADGSPLDGALCQVEGTPYAESTSTGGKFNILVAAGEYRVICGKSPYTTSAMQTEVVAGQVKPIHFELSEGSPKPAQPVPDSVSAVYNAVTGVVTLAWSKVSFPQLAMYGLWARDSTQTGPPRALLSTDTTIIDLPYKDQSDRVPRKVLYYSVYCLKSDHLFTTGTTPIKVVATRPTSFGADLDLNTLPADTGYKVGDIAKVEAKFTNDFRDNRLLQWGVKDSKDSLRDVALTGRMGADTLLFHCDYAGTVQIGYQVTDAAGIVTSVYKPLLIRP